MPLAAARRLCPRSAESGILQGHAYRRRAAALLSLCIISLCGAHSFVANMSGQTPHTFPHGKEAEQLQRHASNEIETCAAGLKGCRQDGVDLASRQAEGAGGRALHGLEGRACSATTAPLGKQVTTEIGTSTKGYSIHQSFSLLLEQVLQEAGSCQGRR